MDFYSKLDLTLYSLESVGSILSVNSMMSVISTSLQRKVSSLVHKVMLDVPPPLAINLKIVLTGKVKNKKYYFSPSLNFLHKSFETSISL